MAERGRETESKKVGEIEERKRKEEENKNKMQPVDD